MERHLSVLSFQIKTLEDGHRFFDFVVDGKALSEEPIPGEEGETVGSGRVTAFSSARSDGAVRERTRTLIGEGTPALHSGRASLYVCPICGDEDCGTFAARISFEDTVVKWSDFAEEVNYFYDSPGDQTMVNDLAPIYFQRDQYLSALQDVQERAKTKDFRQTARS